ncbi:SDR family NAD(P)-dependent oxidoreductase [Paenibacillus sp. GCM10023248]|uniref:SDR family NAD(P)-dependent oxidoreductase n=1 Tax=Bacillales TaxID=1385 RepID=UPI0023791E76|nr:MULTISPECIES: SDR family NAD(P)-dependent oxidoreductase [Bacillales]MDD9269943.1 SDR family NAD(P)-dependent oxidoreductase [Paenibacillus sp. MAHUQ-63]MDR6883163.1 dTDP-glucose 4,6-dehydratase [Bacillus sp. 3255]
MMRGKHALVTGAAGFIGSHLVHQLVLEGAKVQAFIRYNSSNSRGFLDTLPTDIQKEIEVIKGDLRDPYAVYRAVKGNDTIFHLGALIAIPYSYLHPNDVVQTNVVGTLNIAQAALELGASRLIHTSTSEVYGSARYVPMDETHPLQGQSPYSASKIGADKIIESFYCSYALPAVTVRPFNSYGPRQSMRAVIPTIINQALHQSEIVLGNLTSSRDLTFVEDTARAFIHAAVHDGAIGQVINAGSGNEISVGELADKIKQLIGRDLPVRVASERVRPEKSEVDRLFSDSSKAAALIGWKPSVTLEQGLARTIDWIKSHPELYRPDEYVV